MIRFDDWVGLIFGFFLNFIVFNWGYFLMIRFDDWVGLIFGFFKLYCF